MILILSISSFRVTTKNVIISLPGNWVIEDLLERMVQIPQGPNAMLVEAINKLGKGLEEQAKATSNQVLAALAPLQAASKSAAVPNNNNPPRSCYRCGKKGHIRRACQAGPVWCSVCQSDNVTLRSA